MKTAIINTKSKNTHTKSVYDPKLDNFKGKILFKEQFDRAQEMFSNSTFSKEVLEIINQQCSK